MIKFQIAIIHQLIITGNNLNSLETPLYNEIGQ